MELGPLVQATEHVIQEWGEGPQDTDLLQVSYVCYTVLFCQFDKVTPVVSKRSAAGKTWSILREKHVPQGYWS